MEPYKIASEAIAVSLEKGKPLLVLVTKTGDIGWFGDILSGPDINPNTKHTILNRTIPLSILCEGVDYTNLTHFVPQLQSCTFPCALFIFGGQLIDMFDISDDISSIKVKLESLKVQLGATRKDSKTPSKLLHVRKDRKPLDSDKDRIMKLIKNDKLERMATRDNNNLQANKNYETKSKIQNIKNSTVYKLQLKLLDGKVLKCDFEANDKLHAVRSYILERHPEYNDFNFYFFKPIERITLGEGDELKTLKDLDLNMSTLIIKLIEPTLEPIASPQASLNWFKSTWDNLWNRKPTEVDSDSDNESFHTPMLTPVPESPLRPTLSSFSLYGSQSLLSTASTATLSSLRNELNTQESIYQRQIQTESQNEIPDSTVSNGNNVTLQRPNDD